MRALVIGGTGLISTGIVKHLLARGSEVTVFNRGHRSKRLPASVKQLLGDRDDPNFASFFAGRPFDVVIDMICFNAKQAEADIRAFATRCEHFIFCSTVCVYGGETSPRVLIDETFEPKPNSEYGRNKLAAERVFRRADESGEMNVTIVRPSHTYGPGGPMIDNLEFDAIAWDRIERGLPVLCSGDGLGLWQSTHRDDVGKLFAHAAMNSATFGKTYNATRDDVLTWRDYYRTVAQALGRRAKLLFMPADWIVKHDAQRFGLLNEITRYHGAYSSEQAKRDIPEFRCDIGLDDGAEQTFRDQRERKAWRSSENDPVYDAMVQQAPAAGVEPVEV